MNEHEYLAGVVREQLEAGSPLVLVSIMSLQGGSLIEAAAVRESKNALAAGKSRIMSYELSGKDAAAPGMICGGQAEILLDYFPATSENKDFARRWCEIVKRGGDFYLLTHLKGDEKTPQVTGHALLLPDSKIEGGTSLTQSDTDILKTELHTVSTTAVLPLRDARVMVDRIRRPKTLYCFGAGHVAVPTAHLAALAGFRVVVLDDRPEYASAERFPEAQEVRVLNNFGRAFDGLEIDEDSFIVIVTRGHQYDRAVLEESLKTAAGYIGMISSRRKREAIYAALIEKGVKKERLEMVHSPIGIDIGGETPEEIAVSIVAELISVRSRQSR
jgi:xanthine dehydrogenase accessory factor